MSVKPNISVADDAAIRQLRDLVRDDLTPTYDTDFNLLRWLKGHNYNLEEIVPKLKNHLLFRRCSGWELDSILDRPRSHPIHEHWKSGLTGEAVRTPHTIVNIEQTGTNDYYGMLHTHPMNDIMRARVYDLEAMHKAVTDREAATGEQWSVTYVMDLNGLTFDKRLIGLLTGPLAAISTFMSEHYVEMIHSFVLVNAPSFISAIWKIAQPLLPEKTRTKVKILGANWRTEILEIAVPETLPAYWNTPEEPDVFHADVQKSVPFPVSGYYKGGMLDERAKILSVAASKVGFIERLGENGQKMSWTFETDGHFAYGIFYSQDPGEVDTTKMEIVYPKFNNVPGPTAVPLTDSIVLPKTGTYKFWFSNHHAWFHTLKVRYFISVEP